MNRTALTDEQLVSFLSDGFVVLAPSTLTPTDHDHLYRSAAALYAESSVTKSPTAHLDILGDNLRARIPRLDALLSDPVIDGALHSVLGDDYITHPHSFCHRSSGNDQVFHQDGNLPWNERGHVRVHRPDWALIFYYPQAVDATNGPTEIVPGSQYWTIDHETPTGWHTDDRMDRAIDGFALGDDDLAARDVAQQRALDTGLGISGLERRFLHVPAGSVVLAHYDLVHRGSRTAGAPDPRYMFKFYFARARSPRPATVNRPGSPRIDMALTASVPARLGPVVETNLAWLRSTAGNPTAGNPTARTPTTKTPAAPVSQWEEWLVGGSEDEKVEAAYRLGHEGRVDALRLALFSDVESSRRAASHGLRLGGEDAVNALVDGLGAGDAPVRRAAAAGLGTERAAEVPAAVNALIAAGSDSDLLVRSNAMYSLGQVARSPGVDAATIADALLARLAPGAEADNATSVGLSRSTVRQSAAHALAQVLTNHDLPADRLDQLIDGPLHDTDRYVQGLIVEGLARASNLDGDQRSRLFRYLAGRRWNATPAPV